MIEEENNGTEETQDQSPDTDLQDEGADAAEAPAVDEAPAEEAPATAADEAPAEEAPAADAGEDAEPEEALSPKERRRRERSRHAGETRPQRSPDDRATERAEKRRRNAEQRRRWRARRREKRAAEPKAERPQVEAEPKGKATPRVRQGIVVSDKADKTITVRIESARPHRTYGKIVRSSSTLHAHDESNEANSGDTVRVIESRPMSKTKRWRLVEILERAR